MNKFFHYANFAWRVIATGLSFTLFGLGGLVLSYLIIPMINVSSASLSVRHLRTQYAISTLFKFFVMMMQSFGLITYKFNDIDKIIKSRGALIVSNHPTLIDIVVVVSRLRHCQLIVKQSLFRNFFIKRVLQNAGYIENRPSMETIEQIGKKIKQGHNFVIFPEGTRSTPGKPLNLQRGAANISIRIGAPIVLVHINSSQSALGKGDKWYKVPKKKVQYSIKVGARVDPGDFLKDNITPSIAARRLTRHLKFELERGLKV